MILSCHSSNDSLNPKRFVFTAGIEAQKFTKKSLSERLAKLETDVKKGELRKDLEEFKDLFEIRKSTQAQEKREVNRLLGIAKEKGKLEKPKKRQKFFENVGQRLSVILAMLVNDGVLQKGQITKGSLPSLLKRLNSSSSSLRALTATGTRGFYGHEKSILKIPSILDAHDNEDVQKDWEKLLVELPMITNVTLRAAHMMSGDKKKMTYAKKRTRNKEEDGMFDSAMAYWGKMPKKYKVIAGIAATVGGIYLISKFIKSLAKLSGKSKVGGAVGILTVLAGGVYIYGRLIKPYLLWKRMKKKFPDMNKADFYRGLKLSQDGDKEGAKRAWGKHSGIMFKMFGEKAPEGETKKKESIYANEQNKKEARYVATRNYLIGFYCMSKREYSDVDRAQMKQVFNAMKGKKAKVSDIYKLWEANKNNEAKTIPNQNAVTNIDMKIKPKNIYTVFRIIGTTYENYKKRYKADVNTLTLGTFLEKIVGDPSHEASKSIHNALKKAFSEGKLTLEGLDLKELKNYFKKNRKEHSKKVCERLGIDIKDLNRREKVDFYALSFRLYNEATLSQTADEALKNISNDRSPKAIQKAKELFTKTKKRTLQVILPGVFRKFDIADPDAVTPNILKNDLTESKMTFKNAFKLNVVSANFSFKPGEILSRTEGLTLLFVALGALSANRKKKYYSELLRVLLDRSSQIKIKFPSLNRLQPYFYRLYLLAKDVIKNKASQVSALMSAFTGERTEKQDIEFRKRVRNADGKEFLMMGLTEMGRGGIMVGGDLFHTLVTKTHATYEDFSDGTGVIDLALNAGGVLVYGKEKNRSTGMIYLLGKYYIIKPIGIGWDMIKAFYHGQEGGGGRMGAVAKTYVIGAAPYMAICMGSGVLGGKGRRLSGIVKGAAKGLAAPFTMPLEGTRVLRNIAEKLRQGFTRGTLSNLMKNEKLMMIYKGRVGNDLKGVQWLSKEGGKQIWHNMSGSWNKARFETFASNFQFSYNKFFGFNGIKTGIVKPKIQPLSFIKNVLEKSEKMKSFTKAISESSDFANATDTNSLQEALEKIGKEFSLSDEEAKGLLKKMDKMGFKKMKEMLNDGVKAIGKQSVFAKGKRAFLAVVEKGRSWMRRGEMMEEGAETTIKLSKEIKQLNNALDSLRGGKTLSKSETIALKKANPDVLEEILKGLQAPREKIKKVLSLLKSENSILDRAVSNKLKWALRRRGMSEKEAKKLIRIWKNKDIEQFAKSLKNTGVVSFAENVEEMANAKPILRRALDRLKQGKELGKNMIIAIKDALSGVPESKAYKLVSKTLGGLRGVTVPIKNRIINAFISSKDVGALRKALNLLDGVYVKIKGGINKATKLPGIRFMVERYGNGTSKETAEILFQKATLGLDDLGRMRMLAKESIGTRKILMEELLKKEKMTIEKARQIVELLRTEKNCDKLVKGISKSSNLLKFGDEVTEMSRLMTRIGRFSMLGVGGVFYGLDAYSQYEMAEAFKDNPKAYAYMRKKGHMAIGAGLVDLGFQFATHGYSAARFAEAGYTTSKIVGMSTGIGEGIGKIYAAGRGLEAVATAETTTSFGAAMGSLGPQIVIMGGIESIRYMVSSALDARAEVALKSKDYMTLAQQDGFAKSGIKLKKGEKPNEKQTRIILKEARNFLLHRWYNTGEDVAAGEKYDSFFTSNTVEGYVDQRTKTRLKVVEALLRLEAPGEEMKEYNGYRLAYIRAQTYKLNVNNFEQALKVFNQSRFFASIMQKRNRVVQYNDGTNKKVMKLNEKQYDIDKISAENVRDIYSGVVITNSERFDKILGSKSLRERIESLDKNYLEYACRVMGAYLGKNITKKSKNIERFNKIAMTMDILTTYLSVNGIQVKFGNVRKPNRKILKIEKVLFDKNLDKDEVNKNLGPYRLRSKGVAALYEYAKAFGYKGRPINVALRDFFTENRKTRYGIYWYWDADQPDGGQWIVNEAGMDADNECGSNPDMAVLAIINELKSEPDDVIESKYDYALDPLTRGTRDDVTRRANFVKNLANRMENAYKGLHAPVNIEVKANIRTSAVGKIARWTNDKIKKTLDYIPLVGSAYRAISDSSYSPFNWF